jgi:hypothetical protein
VSPERAVALETAWWTWHDADADRWDATLGEAEERCAAWISGESDDGPPRGGPSDEPDDTDACLQCDAAEAQEDARRMAGDE